MRISGKRVPFCCLLQPLRADLSNSVLCPERSRNGSSFLKSQRERRQRQRKKKREEGVRGTHINPVQEKKKKKSSPLRQVTRETQRWRDPSPVQPSQGQLILNPEELFRLKCTEVSFCYAYVSPKSFPFKSSFLLKLNFRQRGLLH